LVGKQIAAILTILGGVFYVFGSYFSPDIFFEFFGVVGYSPADVVATAALVYGFFAYGLFTAVLIIVGGAFLNSDRASRRKAGGKLALVMLVLRAIPDVAGLFIGFILALLGAGIGLDFKENSPDTTTGVAKTTPSISKAQAIP